MIADGYAFEYTYDLPPEGRGIYPVGAPEPLKFSIDTKRLLDPEQVTRSNPGGRPEARSATEPRGDTMNKTKIGLTVAAAGIGLALTGGTACAETLPAPSDFTVGVIVTQKHCFGDYGCNYKYDVDPSYVGKSGGIKNLIVTYSVAGGEDGERIESFTVDKKGAMRFNLDEMITAPDGAVFTATVTSVRKRELS